MIVWGGIVSKRIRTDLVCVVQNRRSFILPGLVEQKWPTVCRSNVYDKNDRDGKCSDLEMLITGKGFHEALQHKFD